MSKELFAYLKKLCEEHVDIKHDDDHRKRWFRRLEHFQDCRDKGKGAVVVGTPLTGTKSHNGVALMETMNFGFCILFPSANNNPATDELAQEITLALIDEFIVRMEYDREEDDDCPALLHHLQLENIRYYEDGPYEDGFQGWAVIIPFNRVVEIDHNPERWQ